MKLLFSIPNLLLLRPIFSSTPFSTTATSSRELAIANEVLNIVAAVKPMEPALEKVAPFITPPVVTSVLDQQPDPVLCFRFFVWASRRRKFRSMDAHNLLVEMLERGGDSGVELYWRNLEETRGSGVRVEAEAFSVLISVYRRLLKADKAVEAFCRMREFGCKADLFSYNMLLNVLVEKDLILIALGVFSLMFRSNCVPNCTSYNILISGFGKLGRVDEAVQLFDEMSERGVVPDKFTYNGLITGLCQAKRVDDAYRWFLTMSSYLGTDIITCKNLLNGFCKSGRMDEAIGLLKTFAEDGFELDIEGYSCMIDGFYKAGRSREARDWFRKVFEVGIEPDVVLCTIMIRGLCEEGKVKDALELLRDMTDRGMVPDTTCYNTLIKGFCDIGLLDVARSLKLEISEVGCSPDSHTCTILICGMCKNGLAGEAQNIFNEMEKLGCSPSVATFNTLIDGFCKTGNIKEAQLVFSKMEIGRSPSLLLRLSQGLEQALDSESLQTSVMRLCESGEILKAYRLLTDLSITPNLTTYNILINGLCKAGFINGALKLVKELKVKGKSPNSVTYGTLIDGLFRVDREDDAFRLFEDMGKKGCLPTSATYKALMTWSCRKCKLSKAFKLWLSYLRSLPKREENVIKLAEDHFERGEVGRAVRELLEMDFKLRDFESAPYTIWLIGFCQVGKPDEALKVFSVLEEYSVNVTPPSCVFLITSLCNDGKFDEAVRVFLYSVDKGFMLKPRICNNLLMFLLSYEEKIACAFNLLNKMKSAGYNLEAYLDPGTKALIRSRQEPQNTLAPRCVSVR